MIVIFRDRVDAGQRLAAHCWRETGGETVVLGLPRGGVPVAEQVAAVLNVPLDVCVVRKLGVPFQPELGMGAIGEDDTRVLNGDVVRHARVSAQSLDEVEQRERLVLRRRARRYRDVRPPVPLHGRTAVVVDDGVATGSTARVACQIARERGARRVILAVPVAPAGWAEQLADVADACVSVMTPRHFGAIGAFYEDFTQTSDAEVIACLRRAEERDRRPDDGDRGAAGTLRAGRDQPARPGTDDRQVMIPVAGTGLSGELRVPSGAQGIVVFAHGSGSSRHSPRNRRVAAALGDAGLGTLLFDLLTDEEALDRGNVFDTAFLARRLTQITEWVREQPEAGGREVGYFGASTGAAAALLAAAEPGSPVAAVVSRGGRPDLAGDRLPFVRSSTLLIVGERDPAVLELNRDAQRQLRCENRLAVVPRATHLFEEPGTMERVSELATDWFTRYLAGAPHHR